MWFPILSTGIDELRQTPCPEASRLVTRCVVRISDSVGFGTDAVGCGTHISHSEVTLLEAEPSSVKVKQRYTDEVPATWRLIIMMCQDEFS